ncbi:MAG: ATP-binding protein [Actinomycetota bacterium]
MRSSTVPERSDERSFPADAAALRDIRSFIREAAAQDHIPNPLADDIVLAVSEASTNAIVHTDTGEVRVRWHRRDDQVLVWVCDQGVFLEAAEAPELDGLGGRGIPLMQALMDDVRLRPGTQRSPGTVVRMAKRMG